MTAAIQKWALILASAAAAGLAIYRAAVQSVTLDEADTYFWFVAKPELFYPYPNNHVLNTILIWVTTRMFGVSSLALRAPALLGAMLYILVCYFLCRSITGRFSLQFPLLICLIYNPFILDYMAAARGYSMANAFLLAAIAMPVWYHWTGSPSVQRCCAWASLALGLSVAANFSFVFVDLAAFAFLLTWAIRRRGNEALPGVLVSCVLPGLLTAALICGYPLAHMHKTDLFYGAQSLGQMARSLVDASLYHMNPGFGGSLYKIMRFLNPLLLPALGILCVCQIVCTRLDGSWFKEGNWLRRFSAALAGIVASSILMHWLAFRFERLPLPLSRTGIFLLPLCTLLAGTIAAGPARSLVSRSLRAGVTAVFLCLAFYFILCLRTSYFKEYEYDADVKDVYSALAGLNHSYGITDVEASGLFAGPLNFYRIWSGKESFPQFMPEVDKFSPGHSAYVMDGVYDQAFIITERLVVIYRGRSTNIVVAVRPPIPAL